MSLYVIKSIKAISKKRPTACIVFSNLGSTGFPFIFSIIININLPPSKAGIGNKLINPTFTLNKAIKLKTDQIPASDIQ